VRVAVADDLEVEVVGVPAAGEHGVQQLSGLLPGQQAVHGVSGDALSRMDGGGIAETGRLAHILNWQPDGQLAAGVPDGEVTAPADVGDGRRRSSRDPGYQSVAVAPKVRQLRDPDPEELRTC
jgi:hypothetical protein